VLGDFVESRESAGKALADLLGLLLRRQVALWRYERFRQGLLRSIVSVVFGTGLCMCFSNRIYAYFAWPFGEAFASFHSVGHLFWADPLDPFTFFIKLSTMCGLFLASPYVLWQVWLLSSPAIYRHRRRHAWAFVTLASTSFMAGGIFAYKLAVPAVLTRYVDASLMVNFNHCCDLEITTTLFFGLVFELPCLCWLVHLRKQAKDFSTMPQNPERPI
jgi:sec-independent protein translocase protein TatC